MISSRGGHSQGSLRPTESIVKSFETGPPVLSSLSEKTRKSNHLQRQHFLLSYLKTMSVGPAGVWTHDLPHGGPALYQLSQPVGAENNNLWLVPIFKTAIGGLPVVLLSLRYYSDFDRGP